MGGTGILPVRDARAIHGLEGRATVFLQPIASAAGRDSGTAVRFNCMNHCGRHCRALAALAALVCSAAASARAQEPETRFFARLADSTMVNGGIVRDWHDVNATPRIENFPLFDANRPVDWLVRGVVGSETTPSAYVEFVGGDRMPGEVIGHSPGNESPYRRLPPHLLVRPAISVRRPNTEFDMPVRITSEHVRRVVWQSVASEPTLPSTVVLRSGQRLTFRALRWTSDGISLLLEDGVRNLAFSELAEVHLAGGDAWETFLDHAATVLPSGKGRLAQLETDDGLVALTSVERLRPETHGDNRKSNDWYQAIQPAWSLDTFWLPFSSIKVWRFFPPERVPVTLLEPVVTREDVVFSSGLRPVINEAVTGGPLGDGVVLFGWGLGSQAPCTFHIPLPAAARSLRGGFALDSSVGPGGCVRARVELKTGDATQKLFESAVLVGAKPAQGFGTLQVAASSADASIDRELVLVSDPVYDGRPAGADPFDIRDALNWLAPELELDAEQVSREIRRRAPSQLPGLAGWDVDRRSAETAKVSSRWDTRDWEEPKYRSFEAVENGYLKISQKLRIAPTDRYLAVFVHCPLDEFRPARIQVRVDGKVIGELSVPVEHGRREPDPLLFPVKPFQGMTALVDILQLPGAIGEDKPAAVDWRGADLVSHRPGLVALFEDDAAFVDQLTDGDGTLVITSDDKQTGSDALKVMPPGRRAASISGWEFLVAEEPEFGEYRFVRFAWKGDGDGPISFSVGHDGVFGLNDGVATPPRRSRRRSNPSYERGQRNGYRYVAGPGGENDAELAPFIKLDGNVPKEWRVVQRDLFGDFGAFTLTGAGFASKSGTLAIDGLYLARSADLFRFVEQELSDDAEPQPGSGDVKLKTSDPQFFAPLVTAVASQFGLSGQGGELQLLGDYRGKQDVLRTHPQGGDPKQAVRLTAAVELPEKSKSVLKLAVSQHGQNENDQKDWDLQIFANGRELLTQSVNSSATKRGWLDVETDLTQFAGQPVLIELRHKASGWDNEIAYWHDVRIVSEPL